MSDFKTYIAKVAAGTPLSFEEAREAFDIVMSGDATPSQIGGFLMALRTRGETVEEFAAAAAVMRARCNPVRAPEGAIDIVGTGGDASGSFNLSSAAALLVAAMGLRVIKHGNRSVSSRSGSADLLEALGLPMPLDGKAAGDCLAATGFTFLFAPHYHPAMKEVAPVRRALGVRTVFNLLGPLTNPAEPPFGLIGAYSTEAARLMADTLAGMPIQRVFVIHGDPGWDEATPVGPFELYDVQPGKVTREVRDPLDLGIQRCTAADLAGGDAEHNAACLRAVFEGRDTGPHCDAIVLNAALALEVAGAVPSAGVGVIAALEAIRRRDGLRLLERLAAFGHDARG